jgi:hypothetical protein
MNYIERIHDASTGEIVEREYTKAEMDESKANEARLKAESDAAIATENAKIALFEKLGLTADEAALLLS